MKLSLIEPVQGVSKKATRTNQNGIQSVSIASRNASADHSLRTGTIGRGGWDKVRPSPLL